MRRTMIVCAFGVGLALAAGATAEDACPAGVKLEAGPDRIEPATAWRGRVVLAPACKVGMGRGLRPSSRCGSYLSIIHFVRCPSKAYSPLGTDHNSFFNKEIEKCPPSTARQPQWKSSARRVPRHIEPAFAGEVDSPLPRP